MPNQTKANGNEEINCILKPLYLLKSFAFIEKFINFVDDYILVFIVSMGWYTTSIKMPANPPDIAEISYYC